MFRVSERFACRVMDQHRSTQRYSTKVVDIEEAKLRRRLWEITAEQTRWSRRMVYRVLRREGWRLTVQSEVVARLLRQKAHKRAPLRWSAFLLGQIGPLRH